MKNIKVLILAGGSSAEKEISTRSGKNLHQAIQKAGFDVELVDPSHSDFCYDMIKNYDIVYPILHGTKGEDGCIQGFLETIGIPYIGCDVLASAITMDKAITKAIFHQIGIPCAKGFTHQGNFKQTLEKIEEMGYPVFVKPANEGSSVGSHIIHNKEEALELLPTHFEKYPHSLIEQLLVGREMTVGVIETNQGIQILPILELRPKAEFYNYDTKYTAGMTEFILPAPMDNDTLNLIHQQVSTIFKEFNLKDCIRVDLILTENGPMYLEINTAPGMTETSDIPAMLNSSNISVHDFVHQLIMKKIRS